VELHGWFVKMRSFFVWGPGNFPSRCGVANFFRPRRASVRAAMVPATRCYPGQRRHGPAYRPTRRYAGGPARCKKPVPSHWAPIGERKGIMRRHPTTRAQGASAVIFPNSCVAFDNWTFSLADPCRARLAAITSAPGRRRRPRSLRCLWLGQRASA
jgi:hypothetical protein